jgi:hypothetical protein
MRWLTLLLTPLAAAISSTARWMLLPIVGGASSSTTPSDVVRNADTYVPSVIQYRFRSTRPTW